jgi:nucleotide-binding universal stress UspA family protein
MKTILLPTDFSACADHAIMFAVELARLVTAKIELIHIFVLNGVINLPEDGLNSELIQAKSDEIDFKLSQLKQRIENERVIVDTAVYKDTVTDGIIKATGDKNIDLIVMGTTGASGIKEKLLGSETGAIIGNTKVPIIVIPSEYRWKKPVKILLVSNHFEKEPAMLGFLFELAILCHAEVHVAVFTDEGEGAVKIIEHGRTIFQYEVMLKEEYKPVSLTVIHLYGAEFEKTLQDYIARNEIDLLAMISYRRTFLERIFHPSVTRRMSYHTKIPLLAIPAS